MCGASTPRQRPQSRRGRRRDRLYADGAAAIGASLSLARHLGVDQQGALYIAEANNSRIRKLVKVCQRHHAADMPSANRQRGRPISRRMPVLDLRGTAADHGTVVSVRWANDRAVAEQRSGLQLDDCRISLQPGLNT